MNSTKKVFICAFTQESNSFNPIVMPCSNFSNCSIETSSAPLDAGAISYLSSKNVECIYGIAMHSRSGGHISDETVEFFLNDTLNRIKSTDNLDGVLLVLHGATMSESCDDVCGYICEKIRDTVGDKVVMSACLDLHANVTEKMMENVDYLCGYWEYPHIDRKETGARAARMLYDDIFGDKKVMARAAVPVMASAHAYTTTKGALEKIKDKAQAMISDGKIYDYSVFQVQPWLDNPLAESSILVIAKDSNTAIDVANELARDEFECRKEIQGKPMLTVEQVIEKALSNDSGKPIVLVDSADSIGAGSTGDSAYIVAALLPYSERLFSATDVRDIPAVEKAFKVGVGNTAEFTLGATIASKLSNPVKVTAKVRSLHDGSFYVNGPMSKGARISSGRTAVLEVGKLLIRVSETGTGAFDVNYYRSFGICFEKCVLVSVKACTSFRASYGPFVSEIYNASTPGAACPVLQQLNFERRKHPLYPFEEISEGDIREAKVYR